MMSSYKVEADQLYQVMLDEVIDNLNSFEKTLWYKQLSYSEQLMTQEIILSYAEYMFDYHFKTLQDWDTLGTKDVLLSVFPYNIVAGESFFEKVIPVLQKYFEFLYYQYNLVQGLELSEEVLSLKDIFLSEVSFALEQSEDARVLELGEEIGLDIGDLEDIDGLYRLIQFFEKEDKNKKLHVLKKVENA